MRAADHLNPALRRVPATALYIIAGLWAVWLFYAAATGRLGVEPIEALEHRYGTLALHFLIASLVVTPLRRWTGISLFHLRRAMGLCAFGFVLAHLGVWAVLDVQSVGAIWADIVKRPYITIGMAAFALLIPLAVTSHDRAIRAMGARAWRRLHRLSYLAAILAAVHFLWLSKGFQLEPMIYAGAILGLLALRAPDLAAMTGVSRAAK